MGDFEEGAPSVGDKLDAAFDEGYASGYEDAAGELVDDSWWHGFSTAMLLLGFIALAAGAITHSGYIILSAIGALCLGSIIMLASTAPTYNTDDY